MPLEMTVDRNSSVPPHEQIKDRIKLGLALGALRPGDNLPSIRQLNQKLLVGVAVVRRAYRELAQTGVLDLQHGRGVFIKNGIHRQAELTVREYDTLYSLVSRELERANLVPSPFARFLYGRILDAERQASSVAFVEDSRPLATDYAGQLSQEWQIPINAFTVSELRNMPPVQRAELRRVLTSYYHVDEVREVMRKHRAKVIPVDIEFHPEMVEDIQALRRSSRIVFVIHQEDFAHFGSYISSLVEEKFGGAGLQCEFLSSGDVMIPDLLASGRYARVIISNRLWDDLDEQIRSSPVVRRPRLRVTQGSVKSAWSSIGVI